MRFLGRFTLEVAIRRFYWVLGLSVLAYVWMFGDAEHLNWMFDRNLDLAKWVTSTLLPKSIGPRTQTFLRLINIEKILLLGEAVTVAKYSVIVTVYLVRTAFGYLVTKIRAPSSGPKPDRVVEPKVVAPTEPPQAVPPKPMHSLPKAAAAPRLQMPRRKARRFS